MALPHRAGIITNIGNICKPYLNSQRPKLEAPRSQVLAGAMPRVFAASRPFGISGRQDLGSSGKIQRFWAVQGS